MKWEKIASKHPRYEARSERFGPVLLTYSPHSKTWYLTTNPWIGQGIALGHYKSKDEGMKGAI